MNEIKSSISESNLAYFHREYANDIPEQIRRPAEGQSWVGIAQRVGCAALPFISLYKPLSMPLAVVMGSCRVISCGSELVLARSIRDASIPMLQTSIAVIALASTILAHPLGMIVTTGQDIVVDGSACIQALSARDYQKALEKTVSLVNNTLYLGMMCTGSLELAIASLTVQVLLGIGASIEEFKNDRWIEGSAHLLMTAFRVNQLAGQVKQLQVRNDLKKSLEEFIRKSQEMIELAEKSSEETQYFTKKGLIELYRNKKSYINNGLENREPRDTTPLISTIRSGGTVEEIKELLKTENVNEITKNRQECALIAAFRRPELLEILFTAGADINIRLKERKTPLHYAATSLDCHDALCWLLEKKANVHAMDLYGRTPLHFAVSYYYGCNKDLRTIRALLDHNANLHAKDDAGWSPLHLGYQQADIDLFKEFVKRKAHLDEYDPKGCSALHWIWGGMKVKEKTISLVKYLIEEQKMDVNQRINYKNPMGYKGLSPLMIAVQYQDNLEDDFEILEYLLVNGADLNAIVYDGYSVLGWAADTGIPKYITNWLVEKGAIDKSPRRR